MSQDTLAIGLFLLFSGITLALANVCLGFTLFKDETSYKPNRQTRRFVIDQLISVQRPEYRGLSYLLYGFATALCLSGTAWMIYHQS